MQLSNRKKKIISILIESTDFVSAASISDQLEVSRRTILRELKGVEEWLQANNLELDKVTGKGVRLIASDAIRSKLLDQLNQEKINHIYKPYERQQKILLELLNAGEPLKIFYFSNMLKVSESTVSYDLDKIEEWLSSWQLELIRKPGYGIVVEGRESNFRKAIIHLFNEYFDRGELLHLIKDDYIDQNTLYKKTSVKNTLLSVVGYSLLERIEIAIKSSGVFKDYELADNAYASLVIHLSLALKRLSEGEEIRFDQQKLEEVKDTQEFDMSLRIAQVLEESYSLMIPMTEVGYIALHIQASRLRLTRDNRTEIKVKDYEVIYLIEKLIGEMENITGYMLVENQQLVSGLINHFGPAISRIKQGIEIKNPLLNEMRSRYPLYFNSVRKAVQILEDQLHVLIPDDEVAYLTMHFAAAVESIKKAASAYWNIAIVCSTGIGSSKLLEARIKKQFKHMIVKKVLSAIELNDDNLQGIDLIVSTIPVESSKALVVVSPLLLEEDIRKVENLLNQLTPLRQNSETSESSINFVETLTDLSVITQASLDLLNNFFILSEGKSDLETFARGAANFIAYEGYKDILFQDFMDRESKGVTWFDNQNARLLHCQSNAVEQVYFGFILSESDQYVAVMVGHKNLNVAIRKLLGHISLNLLDHNGWLEEVKSRNLEKAYNTFESIIRDYYYTLVKGGHDAN